MNTKKKVNTMENKMDKKKKKKKKRKICGIIRKGRRTIIIIRYLKR